MPAEQRTTPSGALADSVLVDEELSRNEQSQRFACSCTERSEMHDTLGDQIECLRYQWFIASTSPDGPISGPHNFSRIYWDTKDGVIDMETRLACVLESELDELSPAQVMRLARGLTYVAASTVHALPIRAALEAQNHREAKAVGLAATLLVTCGLAVLVAYLF